MNATELIGSCELSADVEEQTRETRRLGPNGPVDMDLIDISSLEKRIDAIDLTMRPKR